MNVREQAASQLQDRVQLAARAHLGERLHDLGLRGDRVGGDHLCARELDAPRYRVVAHDHLLHSPSRVMVMAPRGHSVTHSPQPLQYL